MIIMILIFSIIAISATILIIDAKIKSINSTVLGIATVFLAGALLSLLFGGGLCIGNLINQDIEYENTMYEKEVLEARLEQLDENPHSIGNELLYSDIVEFNNNLRSTKKWANNPWTSWFNNSKVASIEYIDILSEVGE